MTTERQRQWGWNIKTARKALGLTQQQLAEALGVRQSSVTRWEHGLAAPRDDMKLQLAAALQQDVRMLFPLFRQGVVA